MGARPIRGQGALAGIAKREDDDSVPRELRDGVKGDRQAVLGNLPWRRH